MKFYEKTRERERERKKRREMTILYNQWNQCVNPLHEINHSTLITELSSGCTFVALLCCSPTVVYTHTHTHTQLHECAIIYIYIYTVMQSCVWNIHKFRKLIAWHNQNFRSTWAAYCTYIRHWRYSGRNDNLWKWKRFRGLAVTV